MGFEPTAFELEVQRANPLRHEGYSRFPTSIKAKHLKIYECSLKVLSDFLNVNTK